MENWESSIKANTAENKTVFNFLLNLTLTTKPLIE